MGVLTTAPSSWGEAGYEAHDPLVATRSAKRELGFCHAHRRNPPASESADAAEAAHGAPVSAHAQASGLFASPVGVQTQARRTAFLTMYSWFFMVPPRLVDARAGTPEAQRRAIRRPYAAHDSWVREGRDGLNEKPP